MTTSRYEGPTVSPARLQALADGVFAIVMTLLVFDLSVPTVEAAQDSAGLGPALRDMWQDFLGYVLSFLVLGVFWLIHHMLFDSIRRYDTTLIWLNVTFLMFAAFIPFSTALFGTHGATTLTAIVYGLNMLVLFDMGWAIWSYAAGNHRLVDSDVGEDLVRGGKAMGRIYSLVMLVPILMALAFPVVSFVLYATVVVTFIAATLLGRWEMVTVWPSSRRQHADTVAPDQPMGSGVER